MNRIRFLLAAVILSFSTGARAESVAIDFDLGDSVLNLLGSVTIPPDGSIMSMGATAVLPAIKTSGGATSVQTGSAQLKDLTADITVDAGTLGVAHVTGNIFVSQMGTSTGPFTNTRTVMFGGGGTSTSTGAGLSLFVSAHLKCVGLFCGLIGDFPVDIVGTNPPPPGQAFSIMLASLNTPGAAKVDGTIPFSLPPKTPLADPTTGTLFLVGNEVSRTFNVPEPHALAQLIAGVICLAGLSLRRRPLRGTSR